MHRLRAWLLLASSVGCMGLWAMRMRMGLMVVVVMAMGLQA